MNSFTPEQLVRYLLPNHPDCKTIMERAKSYDVAFVENAIVRILTNPDNSWENYLPTKTMVDLSRPSPNPFARSKIGPSGCVPDKISGPKPTLPADHLWARTGNGFEARPINPNTGISQIQRKMGPI